MPTVLRSGPYRIYVDSHEPNEPPHVHVDRGGATCKFWLCPFSLASNLGFKAKELRAIEQLVEDHADELLKEWEALHGKPG